MLVKLKKVSKCLSALLLRTFYFLVICYYELVPGIEQPSRNVSYKLHEYLSLNIRDYNLTSCNRSKNMLVSMISNVIKSWLAINLLNPGHRPLGSTLNQPNNFKPMIIKWQIFIFYLFFIHSRWKGLVFELCLSC